MDVVILAGGYGTRLKGIWDGPKCLVPVGGKPVLQHLLSLLQPLKPRSITLAIGHKAREVLEWCWAQEPPLYKLDVVIEAEPVGTAKALRRALATLRPPVLVLNGDTVPGYDLGDLLHIARICSQDITTATYDNVYAGGWVISSAFALRGILTNRENDLSQCLKSLPTANKFAVAGFLDVGTPEGFDLAKHWGPE